MTAREVTVAHVEVFNLVLDGGSDGPCRHCGHAFRFTPPETACPACGTPSREPLNAADKGGAK